MYFQPNGVWQYLVSGQPSLTFLTTSKKVGCIHSCPSRTVITWAGGCFSYRFQIIRSTTITAFWAPCGSHLASYADQRNRDEFTPRWRKLWPSHLHHSLSSDRVNMRDECHFSKEVKMLNYVMKTHGSGCIDSFVFTSALLGGELSAWNSSRLTPRERAPRYPLDRGLGGPQCRSGLYGIVKIPDHTGTGTPFTQ
jgi:hypothetical protein